MRSLLHPEFQEFGASGCVWDREAMVASMVSTAHREATIEGLAFRGQLLADDVMLLTYEAHTPSMASLRSSVWLRVQGKWLLRFHQGTRRVAPAES